MFCYDIKEMIVEKLDSFRSTVLLLQTDKEFNELIEKYHSDVLCEMLLYIERFKADKINKIFTNFPDEIEEDFDYSKEINEEFDNEINESDSKIVEIMNDGNYFIHMNDYLFTLNSEELDYKIRFEIFKLDFPRWTKLITTLIKRSNNRKSYFFAKLYGVDKVCNLYE